MKPRVLMISTRLLLILATCSLGCEQTEFSEEFVAGDVESVAYLARLVGAYTKAKVSFSGVAGRVTHDQPVGCAVTVGKTVQGNVFVSLDNSVAKAMVTIMPGMTSSSDFFTATGKVQMDGRYQGNGLLHIVGKPPREFGIKIDSLDPPATTPNYFSVHLNCFD